VAEREIGERESQRERETEREIGERGRQRGSGWEMEKRCENWG